MSVLKGRKDRIVTTMCGSCNPEQNTLLYEWINSTKLACVSNLKPQGVKRKFTLKFKSNDDAVEYRKKFTKVDLANMGKEVRKEMYGKISKRQKISTNSRIDLNDHTVENMDGGESLFTICNMFCCKDVTHDITSKADSEVFELFLNSMKGLKIKDVFSYVLHKVYIRSMIIQCT